MVACSHQNNHVPDSVITEAVAGLQAITVAMDLGFRRLVLEGDCSPVIKKLKENSEDDPICQKLFKK